MPLRPEERLSAEALERFLQEQHGITSSWSGVDACRPDLRFDIARPAGAAESWAVEVTGLIQYIDWTGSEVNRKVFEPAILRMCKRLNEELGPHMKQGYWLNVTGPFDAEVFRDLERRIRAYVLSGKTEEEALDYAEAHAAVMDDIRGDPDDPRVQWAVQQVVKDQIQVTIKGVAGDSIVAFSGISGTARIPNSDKFAADVDATLRYATNRILEAKLPRMATVSGYDRKVLLVWSGIPFAAASDVGEQFRALEPKGIDGIFFFEYGKDQVSLLLNCGLDLY